jgi:hypothetical protein
MSLHDNSSDSSDNESDQEMINDVDSSDNYSSIIDDFNLAQTSEEFHNCMRQLEVEEFSADDFSNNQLRELLPHMNDFIICDNLEFDIRLRVDTINDRNELINIFNCLVSSYKSYPYYLRSDASALLELLQ